MLLPASGEQPPKTPTDRRMGLLPLPTASQNAGYLTDGINQNKLRKELAAAKKNGFAETVTSASNPSNPASLTKNHRQASSDSKEKDKID